MLKENTIDKERSKTFPKEFYDSLSDEEKAFLDGSKFALDWAKGGIRNFSASRFIEWKRKKGTPYTVKGSKIF